MTRCIVCHNEFKDQSLHSLINGESILCPSCLKKLKLFDHQFRIEKTRAYALYRYEGFIRELLLQLKAQGDIALARVFFSTELWILRFRYYGYTIIPVPSFHKKDEKRGFNHIEAICSSLRLPLLHAIVKTKDHKQSDQTESKRAEISKYLKWNLKTFSPRKKYLLVDDVVTSQNTLKTCLSMLREHGAKRVLVLVVAYNCRNMTKKCERKG